MSTYKFGAHDLDLENYIKVLRTNINTYLEQDPNTEKWSDKDRKRFTEAYNLYITGLQKQLDDGVVKFKTGDTGSLHDMEGVFTDEKAARRLASYANKMGKGIVENISSKQKSEDKKEEVVPSFEDYVKTAHNVDKSWNELDYLAKDEEEDENGVKSIAKRSLFLQNAIQDYIEKYPNSPHKVELNNLSTALNNGFNSEAITAANKAGLTEEFYRSLFETKYDKSLETIKKEREAKQKQEEQQAETDKYNTWLSEQDALYNTNINGKIPLRITDHDDFSEWYDVIYKDGKFNEEEAENLIVNKYAKENSLELNDSNKRDVFEEAVYSYVEQLMRGETTGIDKVVLDILNEMKVLDKTTINGQEYQILDMSPYTDNLYKQNLFFGYNKATKSVGYGHLEWWTTRWTEKINAWKQQNSISRVRPALTFKKGGEIFKFQRSGKFVDLKEFYDKGRKQAVEKRAEENNVSTKQQEYWESKPFENGLDDLDWQTKAQLGSLGADIASMMTAFFPGYGTIASGVLGLGSTAANAAVDFTTGDDYWQDTKNLLTNLAFDTLGLIPGTGSAGKVGKVVNVVRKLSPLLLGYQTWSALTNGEQYANAFKKLMESPKDMTQQDFLMALNGIRLLTGWATFGAGKIAQNQSEKTARKSLGNKDTDIIGVPVHDETKGTYVEVFKGNKAREIRTAIESGDVKQVENVVGKPVDYGTHTGIDWKWHVIPTGTSSKLNKPYPLEIFAFNDKYKVNVPGVINPHQYWNRVGRTGQVNKEAFIEDVITPRKEAFTAYTTKKKHFDKRIKELETKQKELRKPLEEDLKKSQQTYDDNRKVLATKRDELYEKWSDARSKGDWDAVDALGNEIRALDKQLKAKRPRTIKTTEELQEVIDNIKYLKTQRGKLQRPSYSKEELNKTFLLGSDKKTLRELLDQYDIPYEKQGGTLDRVRKFQIGGQTWRKKPNYLNIEDIESNANNINTWDSYYKTNDIYSDLKKNPLSIDSKVFLDTVNQLNDLNLDFTKEVNKKGFGAWNHIFNNLGLNSRYFGNDSSKFDYLGPTTYNRNVVLQGLKNIYTKESPLKTTDNKNVYYDGTKWVSEDIPSTWKHPYLDGIHERYGNDQKPLVVNDQRSWRPFGITGEELVIEDEETYDPLNEENHKSTIWDKLFKENAFLIHAIPRAFYADRFNRNMRDIAIANEKAFLKNPFEYNRYVTGDLGSLMLGNKQAGSLNTWALNTLTSDSDKQQAYSLEATLKGLDALSQGYNADNAAMKTSAEQAYQQGKENAYNRHITSEENRKSLLQSNANITSYNLGYKNRQHEIWDTLWQQGEHNYLTKLKEREAFQRKYDDLYLDSYIINNLQSLDKNLTSNAINIYQKVKNGETKYSELSTSDQQLYNNVQSSIDQIKYRMAGERYGFKPSFLSKKQDGYIFEIFKNGGSIKERIANAERLYKSIKDNHDRNEKRLDRLFKNLYTLKNKSK